MQNLTLARTVTASAIRSWGIANVVDFCLYMSLCYLLFNTVFGVVSHGNWKLVAVYGVSAGINLFLCSLAYQNRQNPGRARTILTMSSLSGVIIPCVLLSSELETFLHSTNGPVGIIFVFHVVVTNTWAAVWLPIDYEDFDAPLLNMVYLQYLQTLWPTTFLYGTVWAVTMFQPHVFGAVGSSPIGTVPGLLLITLLGAGYAKSFLRILSHLARIRAKIHATARPEAPA